MGDDAMVTVPKALLGEVLDQAEGDLWQTHSEWCISTDIGADGRHICDKLAEKIDQLRAAAGLVSDENDPQRDASASDGGE